MKLLISVTSAEEAVAALAGGASILDIKRPEEGSLGAQPPQAIKEILSAVPANSVEISIALGDAPFLPGTMALAAAGAMTFHPTYIKVGLRGVESERQARVLAEELCRTVPSAQLVLAGYADGEQAGSLSPQRIFAAIKGLPIAGFLIDTLQKDGRTLLDHLSPRDIQWFADQCHSQGWLCAMAGSLRAEHLPLLIQSGVDVAGFRGAVCAGDRTAGLRRELVAQLIDCVKGLAVSYISHPWPCPWLIPPSLTAALYPYGTVV